MARKVEVEVSPRARSRDDGLTHSSNMLTVRCDAIHWTLAPYYSLNPLSILLYHLLVTRQSPVDQ